MKYPKLIARILSILIVFLLFASGVFAQALTGTKTIPGSYATISSAVVALNANGVGTGGVTFNIAAGYTETITTTISLTATGTAANPIVFQKNPATTGADPLITAYTGGVGTPSTAVQDGIWRLIGVDYVTINGVDVRDNPSNTTNPSTMEYGYALYKASTSNGCQNDFIEHCTITLNNINNATGGGPMTDGSAGIIVMNALATTAATTMTPVAGGTNSNNKFYSNKIQNCNIGISVIGYAAASPFTLADAGNDIGGSSASTGDTIINYGGAAAAANPAAGVRTLAQQGLNVSYNVINNNNGSGTNHPNTLRGIYINTATSANTTVTYNTITVKGGGTTQTVDAIENVSGSTAAGNTVNINNNTITGCTYTTATTGPLYGIFNNAASPATLTLNNNTISSSSGSASTTGVFYGIYNTGVASTVAINNNTFTGNSITTSTGIFSHIVNTAATPSLSITSNTISGNSTSTTTGVYYGIYNTGAASIAGITNNTFTGNSTSASTGLFSNIVNTGVIGNLSITGNTISGNVTSSATGAFYSIYNTGAVTSLINISSNNLGTGSSSLITFNAANSGAQDFIYNRGGAATAALFISNNILQGINYAVAGTGSDIFIVNTAATLSQAIDSNTFTNLNVNTTGNLNFIADNVIVPATGTQNVNYNSISGTFTKAGAGGTLTLFNSSATSATGAVINNNNNNFSNITVSGATVIAGWVNTDAGLSAKTVQNNIFSNWTGGTGTITGMNINITGTGNATAGNTINTFTGTGTITGITTGAGNDNIFGNTINTLYTTGASTVTGLAITAGTANKIYRNKIYDLQSNNAAGTAYGMTISGGTTDSVFNNLIGDIKAPSSSGANMVRGINITSAVANSTIRIYYNTIYLNASSSGATFGTSGLYHTTNATATTAALDLRNNIITNTSTPSGTGLTVAYRRSSTTLTNYATTSNNNLFYGGTPATTKLIFYDGTNSDQTLTAYKTQVGAIDAQSVTEDLITTSKFLSVSGSSASFLHIDSTQSTQVESGGVNISNITVDYDGQIRQGNPGYTGSGTAPDLGADEMNGIHTGALSGSYNVGTGQTYTSLTKAGGVFAAINSLGLSGNVVFNVTSDLSEDGTNALYKWTESGVGNYTVTIQPDATTLRTISGSVVAGMIRLNTASRVKFVGNTGGTGQYLTFNNLDASGTTGSAFSFINGASNDKISYCNVGAYTNSTTGAILFSTSTVAGGNSNDTVSNCTISGTVASNTGSVCIYSLGTVGKENTTNLISNNNIYNYHDRGIDIPATGSYSWTISGNSLYNGSVSGSINYAAASTLHGIRVLGGYGYSILNNYIGGSAALATGTSAVYSSTLGNVSYQGILLTTTAASPASKIKGNIITNITLSSVPTVANSNAFIGIEADGSGINIGGTAVGDGNTVGSNSMNGSIAVTTTTGTATFNTLIKGINCQSTGGLITGNQVGGIDIANIGAAPAPSAFYGIYVNVASAPSQVNSNIIGSTGSGAASNSIRVLSSSTATNTILTGIYLSGNVTSTLQLTGNTVKNMSHLSTVTTVNAGGIIGINSAAKSTAAVTISSDTISTNTITNYSTGLFYGIYNSGAATSLAITNNTISGNSGSSASGVYYGIYNAGAVTSSININYNNIGTASSSAFTYNAANSGSQNFIYNNGGAATATLSISNNTIQGVNYATAGTGNNIYIVNSTATLSQAINNNTFTNLNVNTTGNITFISDNVIVPATGTQNVNGNSISGTFTKAGVGGTVTLFTSAASSVSGSVINNSSNNFSNITVSGATAIAGWVNTDAGSSTKTIQNNTFSNWTGGTSAITGMNVNLTGTNNATTGNSINAFISGGAITGITTSAGNNNIYANIIDSLYTTGASVTTGIAVTGGTAQRVYRNKIYNLQSNNAGGTVNGISVSGGTTDTVYNNLIGTLLAPSSSGANMINGIAVTSTTASSTIGVYYNTIYINASSSGTNFGTTGIYHTTSATATTATLDLRNNIITNTSTPNGTGITVDYRRSNTTLTNFASTSNNNLFYAGTPGTTRLLFYDGTNKDQALSTYQPRVSPRDAQTVTQDLVTTSVFLSTVGSSASFLHIDSSKTTVVYNGGINISGITTDYDAQIRAGNTGYTGTGTAPEIGADEISLTDITPPTIVYTPFADTTSINNRNVAGISITDGSGINTTTGTKPRIYYKRTGDANTFVDNTSATNGWKYTEATNSSSPFTFTLNYSLLYSGGGSITAGQVQYFIVAQDLAPTPNVGINSGTFAVTPSSVALTSTAFPIGSTINAYKITCFTISAGSNSPVCAGSTVSLSANAIGAVSPTYSWENPNYSVVSSSRNATVTALNGNYTVTVTDGSGCVDSLSTPVSLITRPTANITGSTSVCNGSSVTLNIAVTGNGTISGTLSNGDAFSGTAPLITIVESPSSTTTFTVASLSDSTCTAQSSDLTDSAVVTINSGVWTGATNTDWSNAGNWCGGMPSSSSNATIPAGLINYPVLSTTSSTQNITIATGASLTIPVGDTLNILGAISDSGTLVNSGTISLNGASTQTFPGSTATIGAMANLIVNNTVGITINQSFAITGTLTPNSGTIDLVNNTITLHSDSIYTANVAAVGGAFAYSSGGTFIVQRYIPARRAWRLLTAPLTGTPTIYNSWQNGGIYTPGVGTAISGTGSGVDKIGNASLYVWSLASQALVPDNTTTTSISPGTAGSADNMGYMIFVRGDRNPANFTIPNTNVTTLSCSGQLQTGAQVFPADSISGQYTLIGNPYASPIDFTNVTRTNLLDRFYTWDPTLNANGGYVVLDDFDGDGTYYSSVVGSAQDKNIQSGQAFLVQTLSNGSASLTINESNKSSVNNNLVFRPAAPADNFSVSLYLLNSDSSLDLADGVYAKFSSSYSDSVKVEDALKFGDINESLSIATFGKQLAIDRRTPIHGSDSLALQLLRTTQRNYQFKFESYMPDQLGAQGFIRDNYTGTSTPLNINGTTLLNFNVTSNAASSSPNRFTVLFNSSSSTLPVTFTSVNAYTKNASVAVTWKVDNESNIAKYEVERSTDGKQFTAVGTVNALNNNSAESYSWMDENPLQGNNYYRIESIGNNGTILYSKVVEVAPNNTVNIIAVYPNPTSGSIGLLMNNMPAGVYSARLINEAGQVMLIQPINHKEGVTTESIPLQNNFAKGNYYLEVVNPDKTEKGIYVQIN